MKKFSLLTMFLLFFATLLISQQVDKTQLSLDIQARYQKNFKDLSQYTWQRETKAQINGTIKYTSISAIEVGPDGKIISHTIEKKSGLNEENGNVSQEEELRNYVEDALKLVSEYVFPSSEKMAGLFNNGTVSEINDTYQVQAFNFLVEGDNLNFLYKKNTLDCVSQAVNTKMNGDDVMAVVEYKLFDGMFMVRQIALELPAKKLDVTAVNSKWAKKL
jgi:hypothetical protein